MARDGAGLWGSLFDACTREWKWKKWKESTQLKLEELGEAAKVAGRRR
jgi:hypothetical protein